MARHGMKQLNLAEAKAKFSELVDAACGMTTTEAENAFALSVVESGELNAPLIAREKAQAVKKNGLLELIDAKETLEDIGGLDQLKDWLLKRKEAFSPRARSASLVCAPVRRSSCGKPGSGASPLI